MRKNKSAQTKLSVSRFLAGVQDAPTRRDCDAILKMMEQASGEKPKMWGPSIVGFGSYHYRYPTGREGDMPLIGFSPRKQSLTLYILAGFDRFADLLPKLGKYKTSVGCLYIKRLTDVHLPTLQRIMNRCVKIIRTEGYGTPRG